MSRYLTVRSLFGVYQLLSNFILHIYIYANVSSIFVTFPFGPGYINLFEPFHFFTDQLVVPIGVRHISLPLHQIQLGEQEKKEQTNKHAWVNSSAEGELCNIVHVQTNASVNSSETSTKLLECRLDLLSLVWTLSHADSPLCSGVRCRLPLSVVPPRLPTSQSFCLPLWLASLTTSGHVEIAGPKPFVWFRAKTDKGIVCLADHQHSVIFFVVNSFGKMYLVYWMTLVYKMFIKVLKLMFENILYNW